MKKEEFFIEENHLKDTDKIILSESGKYKLIIEKYKTGKGTWNYSQGKIYEVDKSGNSQDRLISVIQRDYGHFPYAIVENHPDGNDYLICGEHYQAPTIVNLKTGEKKSYQPNPDKNNPYNDLYGFCWAGINPSPDKRTLAIEGCYWASSYEVFFFDFTNPFDMKKLFPNNSDYKIQDKCEMWPHNFFQWYNNRSAELGGIVEVRKSDGTPINNLPEEVWSKLPDDQWEDRKIPLFTYVRFD